MIEAAITLGKNARVYGAVSVGIQSWAKDLERKASLQQDYVKEQIEGNIFQRFVKKAKQMGKDMKKVGLQETLKSLAYATGKGAAVYFGAQAGNKLGEWGMDKLVAGSGLFGSNELGTEDGTSQEKSNKHWKGATERGQNNTNVANMSQNELSAESLSSLDEIQLLVCL